MDTRDQKAMNEEAQKTFDYLLEEISQKALAHSTALAETNLQLGKNLENLTGHNPLQEILELPDIEQEDSPGLIGQLQDSLSEIEAQIEIYQLLLIQVNKYF